MLLSEALDTLSLELDVLYNTTQGRLATHLSRQLTRLSHCEESLRLAVLKNGQLHTNNKHENETLKREIDDAQAKSKKLQTRMQRDRQERDEEKEWIAALWPDDVVLPTILKSYAEEKDVRFVSQVEAKDERRQLEAQVSRRAAKERVLMQLEIAAQWKMLIVPPSTTPEGEYVAGQTYYQNTVTGESVWEAPVAMFYEPPAHWDPKRMDWKDSYGLENFYTPGDDEPEEDGESSTVDRQEDQPVKSQPAIISKEESTKPTKPTEEVSEEEKDEDDSDDGSSGDEDSPRSRDGKDTNRRKESGGGNDEDEDDGDEKPADPAELRVELELAFDRSKQLKAQLEKSMTEERALALQLLNASRDSFEREKEELEKEDEEQKEIERQKRKAKQQEEAAAKASAQAQQRKTMDKAVQPKFVRDSVGKKDMTLSKDDELFEKEIHAFVVEQRADRRYLAAPLAKDDRVKFHHQLDEEFVQMKTMEQQILAIEQTEFDLLEKTALRVEEVAKRCEELKALLEKARSEEQEADAELQRLPERIAALEEATPPPDEPRPSQEDLLRAKERFIEAEDNVNASHDDGAKETEGNQPADETNEDGVDGEEDEEDEEEAADNDDGDGSMRSPKSKLDPEVVAQDEAELKHLKHAVDTEKMWADWEMEEVLRLEDLAAAYDHFRALEAMKRRLQVDIPLYEGDLRFFEQLSAREKELNEKLWAIQASSQVERARFLVERAAREESVFQVKDEYEAVVQRLEDAKRLPRQARNPLEKVQLIEESKQKADALQLEVTRLQRRHEKEREAQILLMALETRFYEYSLTKLHEEAKLFAEKQALWDQNLNLHYELRVNLDMIESLNGVLQGDVDESAPETDTRAKYEEATAVFEEKLQRIEAVRQFLLLCYERESRWRSLAAIALIKDTTSEEWMTAMQRERQEQILTALQQQHEAQQLQLRKEIKLLVKVKELLQSQILERDAKIERLRLEYQRSSEAVRLETEQIVLGLKEQLQDEEKARLEERLRAQEERARLIQDHDTLTTELQQCIAKLELENEQQWHWLTAAKRELHSQRVANEELLMGYQSLEKRRATETNDMRFRISSQITKINGIEMWNLSLKIQAREAHSERVKMQREIDQLVRHHKQQQRLLRLENWKHRVTAQAILTDVDALFLFFAQGVEILAGATPHTNAALRENGGIEILATLAHYSSQSAIRVIASKSLGLLAWNANVTPRALGWKAKKLWFEWESQQSTRILQQLASRNLAFDSVADESSTEMNWLADTGARGGSGESDSDLFDKQKKIMFLKMWNARDVVECPDVNSSNQEYIGLAPSVLKSIIDLCRPQKKTASSSADDDRVQLKIQRNALRSLAIIVMNTRNTAIVGRMDGCIPLLVSLLRPHSVTKTPLANTLDDSGVLRHAIEALANLSFQNVFNQTQICRAGAIPLLLESCTHHGDVDVLLASVRALAHLSFGHVACCEAIFDARGMAVLTKLCHSYRIHDAIDLDVYEAIQTCAAETISNVITMLDVDEAQAQYREDPQQDPTSQSLERNVALAILAANEETDGDGSERTRSIGASPGVATFVLMCASCTRDVAFHGALVLGSIAQHDDIRAAIGECGGIDTLFLLAGKRADVALVAQATWALANATWNRENQYRIARYLDALYRVCTFASERHSADTAATVSDNQQQEGDDADQSYTEQIREHGLCVLANALFYNDANRQLVASQTQWMTLLEHNCRHVKGSLLEHSARAFCSLSYSDSIALALGGSTPPNEHHLAPARAVNGLDVFIRLCGHTENPLVQKHGLYGVINMCLHDANKAKILEIAHGIETLVNLSGSTNHDLCDPAIEALDLLADVRTTKHELVGSSPATVLSPSAMSSLAATDLKKLITLLQDATGSPALVAMASDAIADEVWKKPSAKVKLRNEHGLDTLLDLCVSPQSPIAGHQKVVLSCLWALRNSIADNVRNQDYVGALRGIPLLVGLYDRSRHSDDVVEAVLAVLVALVLKHPQNSQELVHCGLDMLLSLAEGVGISEEDGEARREGSSVGSHSPSKKSISSSKKSVVSRFQDLKAPSKENTALARELLLLVAPYNNVSSPAVLPPLTKSSSPEKPSRVVPTKKPHANTSPSSVHLPSLQASPLAAPVSPSKRNNDSVDN